MRRAGTPGGDSLRGKRVMVAEDDPTVQRVLARLFSKLGIQPDIVDDGPALAEALASNRYDVVIADVGLPGRSGFEIVCERRSAGDTTPFVMLTGDAQAIEAQAARIESVVVQEKPFTFDQLREAIFGLLGLSLGPPGA